MILYGHCEIRTHDFFTSARFQDECLKPDSTKYPIVVYYACIFIIPNYLLCDTPLRST